MTLSNPAQYISGRTVQEQMNSLIDYVDQRAADVALDAIASDVAQVHQDMLDADADAAAAAASAAAAAGTLTNAVKKTGEASQSIAGDIAVAGALSGGSVSSSGNVDGVSIGSGTTPITAGDLTAYGNVSLDDTTLQGNLSVADPSALINLSGAGSVVVPTPTSNSEAATKKYVDDALDNYAPMVRTTGNQTIAGDKRFVGKILERCGNVKNTTGATGPVPLFKISAATKNDAYMNCVMMVTGRTVPVSLTQLIWNSGALTKTDIVGNQTNAFSIMSDTSGNYWVCGSINANNTMNVFVFQCMRNAGFTDPVEPIMQGETPDMTGWTTVVSQS